MKEKRKEKNKKERWGTNGNRVKGRRKRTNEKRWYFGSCEKNKYIKKWNSKIRIESLMQWCFN